MSIPYVIEKGKGDQERVYDLYSRLLKDRIVFIKGPFSQDMADSVIAQLLYLETVDPESDINMYINSPGGDVSALFAIYDVMTYIKPEIVTVGMGHCCSAASFILAGGTKGKRFVLPNTQIMIHELSSGTEGKANVMRNYLKHMDRLHDLMADHYVNFTGKDKETIIRDMERDYWMFPNEAIEYGLVDKIFDRR